MKFFLCQVDKFLIKASFREFGNISQILLEASCGIPNLKSSMSDYGIDKFKLDELLEETETHLRRLLSKHYPREGEVQIMFSKEDLHMINNAFALVFDNMDEMEIDIRVDDIDIIVNERKETSQAIGNNHEIAIARGESRVLGVSPPEDELAVIPKQFYVVVMEIKRIRAAWTDGKMIPGLSEEMRKLSPWSWIETPSLMFMVSEFSPEEISRELSKFLTDQDSLLVLRLTEPFAVSNLDQEEIRKFLRADS